MERGTQTTHDVGTFPGSGRLNREPRPRKRASSCPNASCSANHTRHFSGRHCRGVREHAYWTEPGSGGIPTLEREHTQGQAVFIEKVERQLKAASSNSPESASHTESPQAAPSRRECGNPARVMLDVIARPHKGAKFEFDRYDTLLVGHAEVAHLRLQDDPHFSRHHFRLEVHPPECCLVDLESRNGTFVNGGRGSAPISTHRSIVIRTATTTPTDIE